MGEVSPNQVKTKAAKYRDLLKPMFVNSSLHACKGVQVHIKHKTIRDLLHFFAELAGEKEESNA